MSPNQKRVKYSTEDLIDELKILENEEIKTGIINFNSKTIIMIDNQEIDLHNINSDLSSKLNFIQSSNISTTIANNDEMKIITNSKIFQPLEKQLENENSHLLNFLGQSITTEQLGNKYQAIPEKFVIYRENDFRLPCKNISEYNQTNLLIIICPTECQGGNIYFPQVKKKFTPRKSDKKLLNFVLFGMKQEYKISKITKGLRILIVYKIFENFIDIGLEDLTMIDNENLREILKNITEKNVLISIGEWKIVKKLCDDIKINYKEVYSDDDCPKIVYDEFEDNEYEYYFLGWRDSDVDFGNLIENKIGYNVEKFIHISTPKQIFKPVVRYYYPGFGPKETYYDIDYYPFILINPYKDVEQEIDNYENRQSDDEELNAEVWRINKYFSTIPF